MNSYVSIFRKALHIKVNYVEGDFFTGISQTNDVIHGNECKIVTHFLIIFPYQLPIKELFILKIENNCSIMLSCFLNFR